LRLYAVSVTMKAGKPWSRNEAWSERMMPGTEAGAATPSDGNFACEWKEGAAAVARLAPNVVVVDHAHRAEAQAVDGAVANPGGAHAKVSFSWIKVSSWGSNAANADLAKSRNATILGASLGVLR